MAYVERLRVPLPEEFRIRSITPQDALNPLLVVAYDLRRLGYPIWVSEVGSGGAAVYVQDGGGEIINKSMQTGDLKSLTHAFRAADFPQEPNFDDCQVMTAEEIQRTWGWYWYRRAWVDELQVKRLHRCRDLPGSADQLRHHEVQRHQKLMRSAEIWQGEPFTEQQFRSMVVRIDGSYLTDHRIFW